MSLPRAIAGARHVGMTITWTQDDGTALDLTGATITGTIEDKDGNTAAIAGTLTVTTAASGIFTWAYATADIATAGRYQVQFKATIGAVYALSYSEPWVVEPAL